MSFTPVSKWHSNPEKMRKLRQILADPILVEAFGTVLGRSRPHVIGTHTIESIALHAAHIAGKHDFPLELEGLTRKPEKPVAQKDAFIPMTPEEIDEATKNQKP